MKKLITLIAGLLLVALPVGLAGCDDSDKEIYNDGRLVTDVVIPTSMTVFHAGDIGYRPLRQRQHGVDDPAQGAHDRRDQITLKKP